ncbi:MAG: phytoene synthase [Bacteroidetes bacterium HGW-Bacteroidetes-5]|jgi:phytoene/squalene synthetase|nr:MAG: phytoene synthase [Bacteroidetes bacterium HGW-Bacteroidetes-5]
MDKLYRELSLKTSKLTTKLYSTSFSAGLLCIEKQSREAIYSIYGFLRQADEIVDTFHEYDKEALMLEFEQEYRKCRERGISLNLIINSFVLTVNKYSIPDDLIEAFLSSMKSDLANWEFSEKGIKEYIYGSADVVGLMCLKVMTHNNPADYNRLKGNAMSLSSAFQKINFLRDIKNDTENLSRNYFPVLNNRPFDTETKKIILEDIYLDFRDALKGIRELPKNARTGIYLAYLYYMKLTAKIEKTPTEQLMKRRIRVGDTQKFLLFCSANIRSLLGKRFMR